MATQAQLVVCYSLGTGAGFDNFLAGFSRQLSEDFAECLALHDGFITVPQMILVNEKDDITYDVAKNASAFAVFYSLPETRWIVDATRSIGGNLALTGRVLDDETGVLLSINVVDVNKNVLLFCGCETADRESLHVALAKLAARLLSHFTDRSEQNWLPDVWTMLGTQSFHAYVNWMRLREAERRAQREGLPSPADRLVEHACYALVADPDYARASDKLCQLLARELKSSTYAFVVKNLEPLSTHSSAIALAYAQCLARLGQRAEAEAHLSNVIRKFPDEPLFPLLRACLTQDDRIMSADLSASQRAFGNAFDRMKSLVESSILNVNGV